MLESEIKILIIDDDLVDRITIQRSLAKAKVPAVIDMAEKGNQGLQFLNNNNYDCIFIDYLLPDTNGVSLLREIRSLGFETPVVIVTSQGDERVAIEAIRSGASDYISKNLLTPEGISYSLRTAIKLGGIERERKAAEAALLQSENRLKEAQKLAKLGHWEFDIQKDKITWSEEIFKIYEVEGETELSYEDFLKIIHPEDQKTRKEIYENALKNKKPYQVDYRVISAKGNIKYIATHGTPLLDKSGEVKGFVGTVQDISDRISTQKALQESESRYRMLIETMNEGVVHVDKDQQILFANQRFCEMLGYEKEEVLEKPIFLFAADEQNKKLLKDKSAQTRKKSSDQYEIQFSRKDGNLIYFLVGVNALLSQDGQVIGSLGTFTDITERKKIEVALSSREKLLSTLFENAQSFICTHSLDGHIISVNKAAADLIGLPPSQLEKSNLADFIDKKQIGQFKTYLQEIIRNKQASGLLPFINRQNNKQHYLLYRNVLYQEAGKENYIIVTAQDITDRIHFEKELTKAKLIAEKSVKVKELFLANMSHEIRTPMNGIIGLTEVLLTMVQDEEQKRFLEAIQSSADKLLVIINDILDFSKIDAGKIDFEEIDFSPQKVIRETVQLFQTRARENNNKVKIFVDAEVPEVMKGDPGKLTQILNNLLGNAIKFTKNGQIKVSVEIYTQKENNIWLEFIVQDTGIGIPEDKLSFIFESFTQASNDTSRKYGGTGLGLAITKQLIELQGGTIGVQSTLNQGSTFTFRLPFKLSSENDVPERPLKKIPGLTSSDLGSLRLLLAEDNEINQMLVKKVVSDWGFSLDIAHNGLEAVELFKQKSYDLILMDMQMPEMDGYAAIDFIRKSKLPTHSVPVIALTAHASQGEVQKCLQAGADAYVSKPFKPKDLLQEMAILLKRNGHYTSQIFEPRREQKGQAKINLDLLKEMANGDENFIQEILRMFVQQAPANLDKLFTLAQEKKWPEVKSLAHKMKSSITLIGNKDLEIICQEIQEKTLSTTPEQIQTLISRAQNLCKEAVEEIKTTLKSFH